MDSPPGGGDNLIHGGAGGLDIRLLDATVQERFTVGLAPVTLKVYSTGTNRYTSFSVLHNVTQPFPISEDVLTRFVVYLYMKGLKAGTIKRYLASIHYTQIALGLGNPYIKEMSWLEYVTCRVKRLASRPTRSRLPVT